MSPATTKGRPPGITKVRLSMTYRATGETLVFDDYARAAERLGVTGNTLRVYLAHGRGETTRKVWSDALGAEDLVTVRRLGVDPLAKLGK